MVSLRDEVVRDTREERERRIEKLTGRGRLRATPPPRESISLQEAQRDTCALSREHLRELVHVHDVPVVSLYLNPALKHPTAPWYPLTVFHSLRHQELENRRDWVESLDHRARTSLRDDLDAVERFLEESVPEEVTRCLVVLKAGAQLNRVMTLPLRTRDRLTIDLDPYLEPLELVLEHEHRVLVVDVSRNDARFLTHCLGHQEEIDRCRSFVPTPTVDRSRPQKVQRHRLTHLHWHLRGVARTVARLVEEERCDAVVLAGDRTLLGGLEEVLAPAVRARVIGTVHPDPEKARTRRYWEDAVEEILARRRAADEEEALSELGVLRASGRLASGLSDVVDAVNLFQVRRLLVSDRVEQPGHVCREHHFVSLRGGTCPFCDRELLPVDDVVDELIEIAHLQGVELMLVTRRQDLLERWGGIAAVTYAKGAAEGR
jgi:peptide subunit release factor 1 (eRF1)